MAGRQSVHPSGLLQNAPDRVDAEGHDPRRRPKNRPLPGQQSLAVYGEKSMIITRTPLRISIGGGGTDLPSYYQQHGGFVLSAAISQYVFVSINRMFVEGYALKYSSMEKVKTVAEISHPI